MFSAFWLGTLVQASIFLISLAAVAQVAVAKTDFQTGSKVQM